MIETLEIRRRREKLEAPGMVVVMHSTVTPETVKRVEQQFREATTGHAFHDVIILEPDVVERAIPFWPATKKRSRLRSPIFLHRTALGLRRLVCAVWQSSDGQAVEVEVVGGELTLREAAQPFPPREIVPVEELRPLTPAARVIRRRAP